MRKKNNLGVAKNKIQCVLDKGYTLMSFWKTWLVLRVILSWPSFFAFFLVLGFFEFLGRPHTTASESNCRTPQLLASQGVEGFFFICTLLCTPKGGHIGLFLV